MLRRVGLALVCAVALACTSPTLPLPPPSLPEVTSSNAPGYIHLSSKRGVEPNAVVVIVNQNLNVPNSERVGGAIADSEGSWETDVRASKGDVLDITQEFGSGKQSPPLRMTVP
jgi:hypothetical protein